MCCRFDTFFAEPMAHTILHGLARPFLCLITNTTSGIAVDGQAFHISADLQREIDYEVILRLRPTSSFNRPFCTLRGCDDGVCVVLT